MISGLEFSQLCRWVIDPRYPSREPFNYWNAQNNDWIFINGDYLTRFAPTIWTKRFFFIVHNTDRSFGQKELEYLLPHAQHIYAINTVIRNPRLTTIPLGFVDRQLPLLRSYVPETLERNILIYANFTTVTNSETRLNCINAFKNNPKVVFRSNLTVPEYLHDLCRSRYVLCPEGTGIDTHRVYESLLCGATPVVLRNSLSHLYEKLPVCILSSWSDPLYIPNKPTFSVHCSTYLTRSVPE